MRERYARRRRCSKPRGDAVHHFVLNAGAPQRLGFFSAAPKDERIATLESNDREPGCGFGNEQALDECLWRRLATSALAHADHACTFAYVNEDSAVHELVNQHDVSQTQEPHRPQREQFGIARARTDQIDFAFARHAVPFCSVDTTCTARRQHAIWCSIAPGTGVSPAITDSIQRAVVTASRLSGRSGAAR